MTPCSYIYQYQMLLKFEVSFRYRYAHSTSTVHTHFPLLLVSHSAFASLWAWAARLREGAVRLSVSKSTLFYSARPKPDHQSNNIASDLKKQRKVHQDVKAPSFVRRCSHSTRRPQWIRETSSGAFLDFQGKARFVRVRPNTV